jgi:hypothetical protein
MPIPTDAQIAEIRRRVAEGDVPRERYDLAPLRTRAELFGYAIEIARREGWDEVEMIDALVKVSTPYREDVREVEQVLRPLGYAMVADHLHKIARHLSQKPLRRWPHLTHPSQADIADQSWRKRT